jgi:hypothetical protein
MPSPYQIEQALSAWMSARARLLHEDPSLENDEAALVDLMGPEEGGVEEVLDRVLRAADHAKGMAEAAKERLELIKGRHKRYDDRYESLRGVALSIMGAIGLMRRELPEATWSIQRGRESVQITDEAAIPSLYKEERSITTVDKALLLEALKNQRDAHAAILAKGEEPGEPIAGAVLGNGMENLVRRVR